MFNINQAHTEIAEFKKTYLFRFSKAKNELIIFNLESISSIISLKIIFSIPFSLTCHNDVLERNHCIYNHLQKTQIIVKPLNHSERLHVTH